MEKQWNKDGKNERQDRHWERTRPHKLCSVHTKRGAPRKELLVTADRHVLRVTYSPSVLLSLNACRQRNWQKSEKFFISKWCVEVQPFTKLISKYSKRREVKLYRYWKDKKSILTYLTVNGNGLTNFGMSPISKVIKEGSVVLGRNCFQRRFVGSRTRL